MLGGCAYKPQTRASGWIVVETEHVRVRTNVAQSRAVEIASELQQIRDALAGSVLACSIAGGSDRLPVTVLPSWEFREIASDEAAGEYQTWNISWLADYEGQVILPDDLGLDTRQVYQHELAHHFFASCLPSAPAWLNEGLARLLETASVGEGVVTIGLPPYELVKGSRRAEPIADSLHGVSVVALSLDRLPSIQRVMTMPEEDFYAGGSHASLAMEANYATAWALVHLLELGASDLHPRFVRFLRGLRELDVDPAALFAREFGGVPLQERLDGYVGRGQFAHRELSARSQRRSAARVRRMTAGETHLHRAWLWSGAIVKQDGRRHVREHLAAARRDPAGRAAAHVLAAINLVVAHDLGGAEREVLDGLRFAPADPSLLQAYVELLLERGADAVAAAARLRAVARTPEQMCTLAMAAIARGAADEALALAARGLQMKPRSWRCRKVERVARGALVN